MRRMNVWIPIGLSSLLAIAWVGRQMFVPMQLLLDGNFPVLDNAVDIQKSMDPFGNFDNPPIRTVRYRVPSSTSAKQVLDFYRDYFEQGSWVAQGRTDADIANYVLHGSGSYVSTLCLTRRSVEKVFVSSWPDTLLLLPNVAGKTAEQSAKLIQTTPVGTWTLVNVSHSIHDAPVGCF
jgi:hypothetical protein